MLCDVDVPIGKIEKMMQAAGGAALESVQLFDVYTGEQIEKGKKSVAFSLAFRAADRTLTDTEVDGSMRNILQKLGENGISIRG